MARTAGGNSWLGEPRGQNRRCELEAEVDQTASVTQLAKEAQQV
jgi:hypothetical protein